MSQRSEKPGGETEARGSARRVLDAALAAEWPLVEVFLKSGRSFRCEIGPLGVRSLERREETGVALRLWDDRGREGAVHADAIGARSAQDLVERAGSAAKRHPGGLRPRLPASAGQSRPLEEADRSASAQGPEAGDGWGGGSDLFDDTSVEAVRDLAHRLIGAFSVPGREAIGLRRGWIEAGERHECVVNSLERDVARRRRTVSIGLIVGGSGASPTGDATAAAFRYGADGSSLVTLDPVRLAAEASWRAAASIGGGPISAKSAVVALEPRSAATWVRSLVPRFIRSGGGKGAAVPRGAKGVDLIDAPLPDSEGAAPLDGEGREIGRRALLIDGEPAGDYVDSRNADAREDELGPMRRDSFRDAPAPGPMRLVLTPGSRPRDEILAGLDRGLFVTSLVPHSAAGSDTFVAEVRGVWIEKGLTRRPVTRTLLVIPPESGLSTIVERGSDQEFDATGATIGAPTVVLEGVSLIAL